MPEDGLTVMSDAEAWERLRSRSIGRLAISVAGRPDIFPVNYHVVDGGVVLRTGPGSKLLGVTINDRVALETDGWTIDDAWSVVAKGRARRLEKEYEIAEAEREPLHTWIPTPAEWFVRVSIDEVTGRRFHRGEAPREAEMTATD